jgi:hypothetical protein
MAAAGSHKNQHQPAASILISINEVVMKMVYEEKASTKHCSTRYCPGSSTLSLVLQQGSELPSATRVSNDWICGVQRE